MNFNFDKDPKDETSIAGLRANAVAFLVNLSFLLALFFMIFKISFLVVFFFLIPLIVLFLERKNNFIIFYARQTFSLSLIIIILSFLFFIPFVGFPLYIMVMIPFFCIQVIACFYSITSRLFEIPYINFIQEILFKS